ncbi:MAG: PEP/pyruvate-binding domain-containing protein, partial [Calditrichota bacterium]
MNRPRHKSRSILPEQAKELNCLFRIEELLQNPDAELDAVFGGVIEAIPAGFHYSDLCQARIILENREWAPAGFVETPWMLSADITVHDAATGSVAVLYTQERPQADIGPFRNDENKLLQTLAGRLGQFVQYHTMRRKNLELQAAPVDHTMQSRGEWRVVVDLLRRTDQALYRRVLRKLFVRLRSAGIREANEIQEKMRANVIPTTDDNRPTRKLAKDVSTQLGDDLFDIAARYFTDQDILSWVQKWVQEDRSSFLVATLERRSTPMTDVAESIRRFHHIASEGIELAPTTEKEVRVALIERFFTDQLEYINVAKEYVDVKDFYNLLQRIVFPPESHGKLGGKSAGVFLASRVIRSAAQEHDILKNIKVPKTWHIASDGLLHFVTHNDLDELVEHKYRDIDEVRREYDRIVQVFKHSSFTPEIVQGLSMALDDFEDRPVIVRSSSLLEDRFGAAFSGKYKSLFLANQGPKRQRLEALMDAVAEVYSSTFGPDPIQYRAERGLLDFREEMGIMIQEVVGSRIGKYFFPAFAGVAFSNNEFRWSPRIHREDGLVRLVPGLGTRAVDRLSDDYPILMAPGQPGLRVNVTPDEVMRYSPSKMDVINLETNTFETVDVKELYREHAHEIPWLNQAVSICNHGHMQIPGFLADLKEDEFCMTFEGLVTKTPFLKQMQLMLRLLQEKFGTPVDIEFASDGKDFYLLQCRPQAYAVGDVPSTIPRDFLPDQVLFTAKRYVSN